MFGLKISSYCLMPNHYHLLVQTPYGNLSRCMRHINGVYTQRFNRSHEIDGSLFRGRSKAVCVADDQHLLEVMRYIHNKPVKASLVSKVQEYLWSSHAGYLSKADLTPYLQLIVSECSEEKMKSYRKELWFEVPSRRGFINITPKIEECLRESQITDGLLLCNAMHITASVFINDDESGLHHDYEVWLEKLAPHEPVSQYRHNGYEDNADAHMKRQVMGREVVVAITNGQLDFGTWEQIFYGEFDGRRKKRVLVKIIGE